MKVSVVLPVYISDSKNISMTKKCIDLARENTSIDFELVIVETCSDYFIDEADVYVYEKHRTTCGHSINNGFKCASGDYIALLTNDVFLSEGWLESLMDCFKIEDCGLSTLATTQLLHLKKDLIEEGIWFSVAMIPKEKALFDEFYHGSWNDSDLIMQTYIDGKKMYRNYNCVVDHLVGKTHYSNTSHEKNYKNGMDYFINKYSDYSDNRMFKILTEGVVI